MNYLEKYPNSDNWLEVNKNIKENLADKSVVLYDQDHSIFNVDYELEEIGYNVPRTLEIYIFDNEKELEDFLENSRLDIVQCYTKAYIGGSFNNSIVWKLRG